MVTLPIKAMATHEVTAAEVRTAVTLLSEVMQEEGLCAKWFCKYPHYILRVCRIGARRKAPPDVMKRDAYGIAPYTMPKMTLYLPNRILCAVELKALIRHEYRHNIGQRHNTMDLRHHVCYCRPGYKPLTVYDAEWKESEDKTLAYIYKEGGCDNKKECSR